jgi:hypothetical protein
VARNLGFFQDKNFLFYKLKEPDEDFTEPSTALNLCPTIAAHAGTRDPAGPQHADKTFSTYVPC